MLGYVWQYKDIILSFLAVSLALSVWYHLEGYEYANENVEELCADLFISGGSIWTGTNQSAEAVAVKGRTILAVGSLEELGKYYCLTSTTAIVLKGQLLTPGFIDSHVHAFQGGLDLRSIKLSDCTSLDMLSKRVESYIEKNLAPGEWLLGNGWNNEKFIGNQRGVSPDRHLLDKVSPNNPVWLCKLDLHQCVANTRALELAKIDLQNPPIIQGGAYGFDSEGYLTGIIKDNAMELVEKVIPPLTLERRIADLDLAMKHLLSHGVTSINHFANDIFSDIAKDWEAFEILLKRRTPELGIFERPVVNHDGYVRSYVAPPLSKYREIQSMIDSKSKHVDNKFLRLGAVKGFMDGSLGSSTALMFEDYFDQPGNSGIALTSSSDMLEWLTAADKLGLQPVIHAIGDKAVSDLLDIFESVIKQNPNRDRRFRIEHCQHIRPRDQKRMVDLGIIASVQPYHLVDDAVYLNRSLGPSRLAISYPFRDMINLGVPLTFGSDWIVATASPIMGIHAAVTREYRDFYGATREFEPHQKITVEQALHAYTTVAAYAEFSDHHKGKIAPGYLADLVILDDNILTVPPSKIHRVGVALTILDGQIVYNSGATQIVQPHVGRKRH